MNAIAKIMLAMGLAVQFLQLTEAGEATPNQYYNRYSKPKPAPKPKEEEKRDLCAHVPHHEIPYDVMDEVCGKDDGSDFTLRKFWARVTRNYLSRQDGNRGCKFAQSDAEANGRASSRRVPQVAPSVSLGKQFEAFDHPAFPLTCGCGNSVVNSRTLRKLDAYIVCVSNGGSRRYWDIRDSATQFPPDSKNLNDDLIQVRTCSIECNIPTRHDTNLEACPGEGCNNIEREP